MARRRSKRSYTNNQPSEKTRLIGQPDQRSNERTQHLGGSLPDDLLETSTAAQQRLEIVSFGTFLSVFALCGLAYFLLRLFIAIRAAQLYLLWVSIGISTFTLVGITVSFVFREIIYLFLLSFLTTRGRAALLSMLLIAVANGPYYNIKYNLAQFNKFFICTFNNTVGSENLLAQLMTGRTDLKETFRTVIEKAKQISAEMKATFDKLVDGITDMRDFLIKYAQFVQKLTYVCNEQYISSVFTECTLWFKQAGRDCEKKMWKFLRWSCKIVDSGRSTLCYSIKTLKGFCELSKFVGKALIKLVASSHFQFRQWDCPTVQKMFFFEVNFKANYFFKATLDIELVQLSDEVEKTIFDRGGVVDTCIAVLKMFTLVQILCALFSACRYRAKYIKYDYHDNYIIEMPEFENVNDQRKRVGAESVYPLSFWERQRFIKRKSVSCSNYERRACCLGCCKVICVLLLVNFVLLADFLLFKAVTSVESYARVIDEAIMQETVFKVQLQGNGFITKLYQQMIDVILPKSKFEDYVSTNMCHPQFSQPNYAEYSFMFVMEALMILSVMLTPYILRLRSAICHSFHPHRRQKRTLWLINQILVRRKGSLIPFGEIAGVRGSDRKKRKITCWAYCLETMPLLARVLKCLIGYSYETVSCYLCATVGKPEDMGKKFVDCLNLECKTVYCVKCSAQLYGTCIVCNAHMLETNDQKVELEKDSSEDEGQNTIGNIRPIEAPIPRS